MSFLLKTSACLIAASVFSTTLHAKDDTVILLEKRVEALEKALKQALEQQKRFDQPTRMDPLAPTTDQPSPQTVSAQNTTPSPKATTTKVTVGGFVNRMAVLANNGNKSRVLHVDNNAAPTRFWLRGTHQPTKDFAIGSNLELQFDANSSFNVDVETPNNTPKLVRERKIEVFFKHKGYGDLYVGRGDMASNGTAEVDLSKTDVIASSSAVQDTAGGLLFRENDNTSGPKIGDVFDNLDGRSRQNRIRYDTPSFYGFRLAASHESGRDYDTAIRYKGVVGPGVDIAAAFAYAHTNKDGSLSKGSQYYVSSLSVLFKNGLNFTTALTKRDFKDAEIKDSKSFFAKAGYIFNVFEVGKSAISFDYTRNSHINNTKDNVYLGKGSAYGLFAVQNINEYGLQLYGGGRLYQFNASDNSKDYKDIFTCTLGCKLNF